MAKSRAGAGGGTGLGEVRASTASRIEAARARAAKVRERLTGAIAANDEISKKIDEVQAIRATKSRKDVDWNQIQKSLRNLKYQYQKNKQLVARLQAQLQQISQVLGI